MSEEAGSPESGGSAGEVSAPVSSEGSAPDWGTLKSSLGELGNDKSLESYKDFTGFAKSHIELQKMIGNSIRLPKKDLSPEEREKSVGELTSRLRKEGILEAVPETVDGYELPVPEMEGFKPNEPLINGFKEVAHKLQIPPSKANELFSWYLNYQQEQEANTQVEFETMKASMKKEMGGLYPRKMEAARRAVSRYLGVDGDNIISSLPPNVGKKLVMAFAEIGDPMLEDGLILGESIPGVESKDAVGKKLTDMVNDPKHPLNDLTHSGHQQALEEYKKLNSMYVRMK